MTGFQNRASTEEPTTSFPDALLKFPENSALRTATATRLILELTDKSFAEEIFRDSRPILVCFYSLTCAPSHQLTETIELFAAKYSPDMRFAKLAIPENPLTVADLRITAIPTIRILKAGNTHWHYPGIPNAREIRNAIEVFVEKKTSSLDLNGG
jgi:thioredoxin 1